MNLQWKTLLSLGFVFWGLLCCTDILGESTWKRCSHSFDDILMGHHKEISKMYDETKQSEINESKQRMTWSTVLWNVCAFLCSLIFCSVLRSMSWIVWKLFKIYSVFRNRKAITHKIVNKIQELDVNSETDTNPQPTDTKLIFKNQQYSTTKEATKQEPVLSQELDELKKEKNELSQQLMLAQKENLVQRQQIEEFKLETVMIREKLARTAYSLKENLKHKDLVDANQELIARKAHSLELHLREVSRDRDILRAKLSTLERNYSKVEEQLKMYEKQCESETNLEQFPERDTTEIIQPDFPENDVDMCKFQKKIMALQRSIGSIEAQKKEFEANSKISVDLEDSSLDTSKENEPDLQEKFHSNKIDSNIMKQNVFNYNAYKTQMLRPKIKSSNIKESFYSQTDTTGSSSDENSGPHRIISSTVEFQNFLKTLTSSTGSGGNKGSEFS